MLNKYDVVQLKIDLPEYHLKMGMQGVVLLILDKMEEIYEVEFCNNNGETIVELALAIEYLEAIKKQPV